MPGDTIDDIVKKRGRPADYRATLACYVPLMQGGIHLRAGRIDQAVKSFHQALSADPTHPEPYPGMSRVERKRKRVNRR